MCIAEVGDDNVDETLALTIDNTKTNTVTAPSQKIAIHENPGSVSECTAQLPDMLHWTRQLRNHLHPHTARSHSNRINIVQGDKRRSQNNRQNAQIKPSPYAAGHAGRPKRGRRMTDAELSISRSIHSHTSMQAETELKPHSTKRVSTTPIITYEIGVILSDVQSTAPHFSYNSSVSAPQSAILVSRF